MAGRTITSYQWNFGDGATASGMSVSHAFEVIGTFPVTLTITPIIDVGLSPQVPIDCGAGIAYRQKDFSKVTQTLTQFTTFSVPMIYPFSLVEERFGGAADYYLLNPLAEAVLLVQRCFWVGTTDDRASTIAEHLPPDLWVRGGVMLALSVVFLVLAQMWFTKFERRVPERL